MQTDVLRKVETLLTGMLEVPLEDSTYQEELEKLGKKMGFSAMISAASAAWARKPVANGTHRVLGPRHGEITALLQEVRTALR